MSLGDEELLRSHLYSLRAAKEEDAIPLWSLMQEDSNTKLFRQVYNRSCDTVQVLKQTLLLSSDADSNLSSTYTVVDTRTNRPVAFAYAQVMHAPFNSLLTALFASDAIRCEITVAVCLVVGTVAFAQLDPAECRARTGFAPYRLINGDFMSMIFRKFRVVEARDPGDENSLLFVMSREDWTDAEPLLDAWLATL